MNYANRFVLAGYTCFVLGGLTASIGDASVCEVKMYNLPDLLPVAGIFLATIFIAYMAGKEHSK